MPARLSDAVRRELEDVWDYQEKGLEYEGDSRVVGSGGHNLLI